MIIGYHDLREISPSKAREVVGKVLENNNGNVSKTARILGISRHTVRRARDGSLEDLIPKCPNAGTVRWKNAIRWICLLASF